MRFFFIEAYESFSLSAAVLHETITRKFITNGRDILIRWGNYQLSDTEVNNDFLKDLTQFSPDAVGFSTFFWNFRSNIMLAEQVKKFFPECDVIFGGAHAESANAFFSGSDSIDYVIHGEADLVLPELLLRLDDRKLSADIDIAGVSSKNITNTTHVYPELDQIPSVFHDTNHYLLYKCFPDNLVSIQTLRGCKGRCTYCLYGTAPLRYFPVKRIEEEMRFLFETGCRNIRICDGHFGGEKDRAEEILKILTVYNREHNAELWLYPDIHHLDDGYIKLLKKAGARIISLGVETLDQSVGIRLGRENRRELVQEALSKLGGYGITLQIDMMYGLPGQTADSFISDIAALKKSGTTSFLLSPLMGFPGTLLYKNRKKYHLEEIASSQNFMFDRSLGIENYARFLSAVDAESFLQIFENFFSIHPGKWEPMFRKLCDDLSLPARCPGILLNFRRWSSRQLQKEKKSVLDYCITLCGEDSAASLLMSDLETHIQRLKNKERHRSPR